jgi:hypothetical protein
MTSFSSKALDKQFEYNRVGNWDALSTLPVKKDFSQQVGWTQVNWGTLQQSLEGKQKIILTLQWRGSGGLYTSKVSH